MSRTLLAFVVGVLIGEGLPWAMHVGYWLAILTLAVKALGW